MQQLAATSELDFHSETYKDAYSRINAIVIEGEQEAHEITSAWVKCYQNSKMI